MSVPDDQPCPRCGRYKNRGLSIDAVIVRDGKILLGKRGAEPCKGQWATIGGYVEWGEKLEEALVREVFEETGLKVTSWRIINVYSDPARHPQQAVNVAYVAETQGDPRPGDDIEEVKWVPLDQIPDNLAFDHAKIIADYKAGASGSLDRS
ncbi:MAG TPA: NUDIX hydrolase [Verrucomicrobiae bacterium]|nr:NUDIX hydrolase [Verrucomicrobiae bacterium]